jgi:hypothetical protein
VETMAAAEMLMEAAAMEAAAMNAQMMAEAAANEAAAEAVAVETMAAVEMTAGLANLHGYGYAQVSTQVSNGSAARCQAGHVDHAAEEFPGRAHLQHSACSNWSCAHKNSRQSSCAALISTRVSRAPSCARERVSAISKRTPWR